MAKNLPAVLRSVLYALRGGFLVRPFVIAFLVGTVGAVLSSIEERYPAIQSIVPWTLFPSHADPQVAHAILTTIATATMTVVSIVFAISRCNLHANNLPWVRHVGEMRMSVSAAHRGRGVGKALAGEIFSIARARGLKKLRARMAVSQGAAQNVLTSLGFRTEALLSDFVRNDHDLTESLVIVSRDFGERWSS